MVMKITVGIPTFNGAEYIAQAIDSVLFGITEELRGRVQVLVSDNCSSDATATVVAAYVERYPGVVLYRRNQTNIGFDRNVQEIFQAALGEYVHILGDDDLLASDSLARIIRTVDDNAAPAIILSRVDFLDVDSGAHIDGRSYEYDRTLEDGDEFFRETGWGSSAVSSLVFKREAWLQERLDEYLDSQWIHSAAVMKILANGGSAFLLRDRIATVRVGNPRWSTSNGNQLLLGMKYLELMSELQALGYRPDTFAWYVEDRWRTNRRDILTHRARNALSNVPTAILMARFFGGRIRFWCVDALLLLVPGAILEIGRRGVRTARAARQFKSSGTDNRDCSRKL